MGAVDDAQRARSFGLAASTYERFRPLPPLEAVTWALGGSTGVVVDLGAGTGALTRQLVALGQQVIAVEPDAAMREEFCRQVQSTEVRAGTGEDLPFDNASVDAIVASTSWHWVDPVAGLSEAARVLRPGGTLAALWTGVDPESEFIQQARAILSTSDSDSELRATVAFERGADRHELQILDGFPFDAPQNEKFHFTQDLTADQLVGLLSTMSWIILMDESRRNSMLETARRLLRDALGVEGDVTVPLEFECDVFRTVRH